MKGDRVLIIDSKFGSSTLGQTDDGTQLSFNWVKNRLSADVDPQYVDMITSAWSSGRVACAVYHIDAST